MFFLFDSHTKIEIGWMSASFAKIWFAAIYHHWKKYHKGPEKKKQEPKERYYRDLESRRQYQ